MKKEEFYEYIRIILEFHMMAGFSSLIFIIISLIPMKDRMPFSTLLDLTSITFLISFLSSIFGPILTLISLNKKNK